MHLGADFEEKSMGVERLDTVGGVKLTESNQTPNTVDGNQGVRLRVLTSVVKRETTQTTS